MKKTKGKTTGTSSLLPGRTAKEIADRRKSDSEGFRIIKEAPSPKKAK